MQPKLPSYRAERLMLLLGLLVLCMADASATAVRFRASWREDPSTSMVIAWHQSSGHSPKLLYDVIDFNTNIGGYRNSVQPDRFVYNRGMKTAIVRLRNLHPNTVYYFMVVDSDGHTRRMSFQTAPNDPNTRLSIIAGGDSRNNREARIDANKLVSKLRPNFVLFGGDMTSHDEPMEWLEWLDDWQHTIGSDGRLFPIVVTRGNHEADNKVLVDLFDIPHEEAYYALNFGGNLLRVYTLNTLIATGAEQRDWLERDLQGPGQAVTWRIAQYHHPMLPHTHHKADRPDLVSYWAPLFHYFQVNLVIECDAHVVKTTWPIRPGQGRGAQDGFVRDDLEGTVYIGEGCWGAPLREPGDDRVWTRGSGRFNQFSWIFVDQSRIEVRVVQTDLADRVAEVDKNARFAPPYGLVLWSPENGEVVTIPRRQSLASVAPGRPIPPPPTPAAYDGPVITRPGSGGATMARAAPAKLRCDAGGQIRIVCPLPHRSNIDVIVIGHDMREVTRFKYPNEGPGEFNKLLDLSRTPPGQYQIVVKAEGGVVSKYLVQR